MIKKWQCHIEKLILSFLKLYVSESLLQPMDKSSIINDVLLMTWQWIAVNDLKGWKENKMGNEFVDVTNMKLVNIVFPGLL